MPYRAECVEFQFGDGVADTAIAITTAPVSAGVVTVTATGIDVQHGDTVLIAGSTGLANFNGYHAVRRGADANEAIITDGTITGTLGTPGTIQKLNGAWTLLAEISNIQLSEATNLAESAHLDDCTGIITKTATTVNASATIDGDWRPDDVTQGLITGLRYLTRNKANVWWRIKNLSVDEADPPYTAFMGVISQFDLGIQAGENQSVSFGLGLNTPLLMTP